MNNQLLKYSLIIFEILRLMLKVPDGKDIPKVFLAIFINIILLLVSMLLKVESKYKVYAIILCTLSILFTITSTLYVPLYLIILLSLYIFTSLSNGLRIASLFSTLLALSYLVFNYNAALTKDFNIELIMIIPSVVIGYYLWSLNSKVSELEKENLNEMQLRYELKDEGEDLRKSIGDMKELYTLKERNRISRDIHDSVGHVLTAVIIQLEAISKLLEKSNKEVSEMALELRDFTKNGLSDVRAVVHKLKPMDFEKFQFIDSLEDMVEEFKKFSKIDVNLNINKVTFNLTDLASSAILRCTQEFLGNSAKYSKCHEINIRLHFNEDELILTMEDDGIGQENFKEGYGIKGTRERIKSLGGFFECKTSLNNGFYTRIILHKGA